MIERYSLPEMSSIWTDEQKYRLWLKIELLVCEAFVRRGEMPAAVLKRIRSRADFNIKRVEEIEAEVHHDVIAFLTAVAEKVGPDSVWIHRGLTSSDILDTSLALQMKASADVLLNSLAMLSRILKSKARKYKNTVMIGRTHGIHAEPVTFGLKLARWWQEIERHRVRLRNAGKNIAFGKISGAVGTYSNLSPEIEKHVCNKLGLAPEPVSSQIVERDRHAEYLNVLALIGSSLENFAVEIRHLQKTEVLEVEEPFARGQKGSSAMPHKRNPILCERIAGLARLLRGNAVAGMENVTLWHERDISHSSVERVVMPDSSILAHYMIEKFIDIISGMHVYPERMKANLEKTGGLIFSQRIMLALTRKGLTRERAYRLVQRQAMKVWADIQSGKTAPSLEKLLENDAEVRKHLNPSEIKACFSLEYYMRNVPAVFRRIKI